MSNLQKTAVIYVRVPVNLTYSDAKYSNQEQRKICEEFADKEGYQVLNVFMDWGAKGNMWERPAFQEAIKFVQDNKVGAILVDNVTRITRNLKNCIGLLDTLEKVGATLFATTEFRDSHIELRAKANRDTKLQEKIQEPTEA